MAPLTPLAPRGSLSLSLSLSCRCRRRLQPFAIVDRIGSRRCAEGLWLAELGVGSTGLCSCVALRCLPSMASVLLHPGEQWPMALRHISRTADKRRSSIQIFVSGAPLRGLAWAGVGWRGGQGLGLGFNDRSPCVRSDQPANQPTLRAPFSPGLLALDDDKDHVIHTIQRRKPRGRASPTSLLQANPPAEPRGRKYCASPLCICQGRTARTTI